MAARLGFPPRPVRRASYQEGLPAAIRVWLRARAISSRRHRGADGEQFGLPQQGQYFGMQAGAELLGRGHGDRVGAAERGGPELGVAESVTGVPVDGATARDVLEYGQADRVRAGPRRRGVARDAA